LLLLSQAFSTLLLSKVTSHLLGSFVVDSESLSEDFESESEVFVGSVGSAQFGGHVREMFVCVGHVHIAVVVVVAAAAVLH
jgi:hypothetical protein